MSIDEITNNLLQMTVYNPLFVLVAITVIWFLPGILVRRIVQRRFKASKIDAQAKAIARLYPRDKNLP